MSIKLNSSGGGSVTLQEPVTASTRTLNLPDADGTVMNTDGSGNAVISGTMTAGSFSGNGSGLTGISAGLPGTQAQIFTSSGTFTVPTGVTAVKVTVIGGGGGGGSTTATNSIQSPNGGGGGGIAVEYLTGLTPGATVTVTIGSGGAAATAGGTSSFGTYCSATGGAAGGSGGAGGVGSGGSFDLTGGNGGAGAGGSASGGCASDAISMGGPGGGYTPAGSNMVSAYSNPNGYLLTRYEGVRGTGYFGGFGGAARVLPAGGALGVNGNAATGYGCGGSGAAKQGGTTVYTGGAGSGGIVVVEY